MPDKAKPGKRIRITFEATVTSGKFKGRTVVPYKDEDGNYIVIHPDNRVNGSAFIENCVKVRGSKLLKKYIEDGYQVRMMLPGERKYMPSLFSADSLRVTVEEF